MCKFVIAPVDMTKTTEARRFGAWRLCNHRCIHVRASHLYVLQEKAAAEEEGGGSKKGKKKKKKKSEL